jgi:hypothetical protein
MASYAPLFSTYCWLRRIYRREYESLAHEIERISY